uniref:Protein tyrosine phosphatase type IVA 2-like n=1 Tax=Crotalus adamanteus TaxID=8729 RepID=J3S0K6_CROAD
MVVHSYGSHPWDRQQIGHGQLSAMSHSLLLARHSVPAVLNLPTNATLTKFTEELKKYGVTTLVRVCDATYDKAPVEKEGIQVLDWPFDDGAPPPGEIVEDWFNLLKTKFREEPGCCVAVHCVAGLGRAPVLVALALIECGMKYEDAVQFIRQKRRGAFNSKQLLYLEKYRPKMRLRFRDANGHCIVQ